MSISDDHLDALLEEARARSLIDSYEYDGDHVAMSNVERERLLELLEGEPLPRQDIGVRHDEQ